MLSTTEMGRVRGRPGRDAPHPGGRRHTQVPLGDLAEQGQLPRVGTEVRVTSYNVIYLVISEVCLKFSCVILSTNFEDFL